MGLRVFYNYVMIPKKCIGIKNIKQEFSVLNNSIKTHHRVIGS
jgi:hypothetical protein